MTNARAYKNTTNTLKTRRNTVAGAKKTTEINKRRLMLNDADYDAMMCITQNIV